MRQLLDHPTLMGIACFLFLWTVTSLTVKYVHGRKPRDPDTKDDFGVLLTAVLTLLGLVIGFTFSMAINRYDERKSLEAAEANAIGTEYVRTQLMPAADAAAVRRLLKEYTEQRILYYGAHSPADLNQIAVGRAALQDRLWASVLPLAGSQPTPLSALVVAGMNDVLNSQGYAHAAWLNRIPVEAWALLLLLALLANSMLVFSARSLHTYSLLLVILPAVVAVSLMLIADIDSPRGGLITVAAPNLRILVSSMH